MPDVALAASPWRARRPRPAAWAVVLALHAGLFWAWQQLEPLRAAVTLAPPLVVQLLAPRAAALPPPPELPKVPPPRVPVAPLLPVTSIMIVQPPPRDEPAISVQAEPRPVVVAAVPAPPLVQARPEPSRPPKTVDSSAVQYIDAPAPVYPRLSRRFGEAGRVVVRVLIGADGRAVQSVLQLSSGHQRLDVAALEAIRLARFKPYVEDGQAQPVWVLLPIQFDLDG